MGSIDRRIQQLEELYGMPSALDEEARRRRAQEALDEIKARMQRIIVEESGHAPDDLTPEADEDNTVRAFYQEVFGVEAGDEEWRARVALCQKYGAVSLAPLSEQQKLRRFS